MVPLSIKTIGSTIIDCNTTQSISYRIAFLASFVPKSINIPKYPFGIFTVILDDAASDNPLLSITLTDTAKVPGNANRQANNEPSSKHLPVGASFKGSPLTRHSISRSCPIPDLEPDVENSTRVFESTRADFGEISALGLSGCGGSYVTIVTSTDMAAVPAKKSQTYQNLLPHIWKMPLAFQLL